jgi:hypothetical protein
MSAEWRTNPALSRNLKPPPLGGGVFTRAVPDSGCFSTGVAVEGMHNFGVLARVLQQWGFNIFGPCDFK